MKRAAEEYDRMVAALEQLEGDDWKQLTDCPEWDVRQLACHMVGMAAMAATPLESARQQKLARAEAETNGGSVLDALTGLQVHERDALTPAEVVDAARRVGPRAARGRRFTPGFIRRRLLPEPQHVNGVDEPWTLGYLIDVILTRDPWMHRIDLAQATGRALELSAEHDGAIVDDIVREWAERHDRPYDLELTGPAGGRWSSDHQSSGQDAVSEPIVMDAIEFCRTLSGRATGAGLLTTQVPF
jgi:uncharacterized protein (TIGR03083 family)